MVDAEGDKNTWRGCSMEEIYRNLPIWELRHFPSVRPSENHTVLYHLPLASENEIPKPQKGTNKWDSFHVRLPCSSKSQYPVTQSDRTVVIENRWLMIEKALLKPIKNVRELQAAILTYNTKYEKIWKFRALHKLFDEELDEEETSNFFDDLLPKIIRLALRLPELILTAIPLLKQGENRSISLSQQQIGCLLANAFLCTYPRRNTTKSKSEYSTFPDINFNKLFQSSGPQVLEKIKCILHYFRRICDKMPVGVMTFTRRSFTESELPNWENCNAKLGMTPLHVTSCGTIEDQGQGLLQVDFANKFLGGGVLGSGCVQEEIRFVICPELIISKLFTEALKPCEALVMIGCEQFSKYKGYASTFKWSGDFEDQTPYDDSRRRMCHIVAIDALYFSQSSHQFREEYILRELNKAYVGFFHPLDTPAPGVASGNWGCGAFGGEATLKALIQLMACTVTKRPLVYFTFGNRELRDNIHNMHTFFIENHITVKELWKYLKEFQAHKLNADDLYSFIIQIHRDYQSGKKSNSDSSKVTKEILPKVQENKTLMQTSTVTTINKDQKNTGNIFKNFFMSKLNRTDNDTTTTYSKRNSSSDEELNYEEIIKNQCSKSENITETNDKVEKNLKMSELCVIQSKCNVNIDNTKTIISDSKQCIDESKNNQRSYESDKKSEILSTSESSSIKSVKNDSKSTKDPKQRTLLDMLDVFYNSERPVAKRYCASTNNDTSNS